MPSRTYARFLSLLLLLTLSLGGLSGCGGSLVQTYEDPIEGPTRGFVLYLDLGHYTAMGVTERGDTYELEVMFVMRGDVDEVVPAGRSIVFKVGSEVIEIPTTEESRPVTNANGATVFTQWKLRADLPGHVARALAARALMAIRTRIASEDLTLLPDSTQQSNIQESLTELTSSNTR